jgi:hypothetical protein
VIDGERRNERQPKAGENSEAPQLRVGRNEVPRDVHRDRPAVRVGEAPFVSERVEGVANAVVSRKIGGARRLGMGFKVRRRAAQHVAPVGQAPHHETRIGGTH